MIYKKLRPVSPHHRKIIDKWKMRLEGIPCFIIGNSPCLLGKNIGILKDFFTIGINRVFKKCKGYAGIDPTILIWQDVEFWYNERNTISKLECIKYCQVSADPYSEYFHFEITNGPFKLPNTPTVLHGRGSTGPLAFELAYILGCNPIILVGYDCKYMGSKTDFYGVNQDHKEHTLYHCSRGLNWIHGLQNVKTIIDCSGSGVFNKTYTIEKAIALVSHLYPFMGRKYFVDKLMKT
jgi:hypothetical protein